MNMRCRDCGYYTYQGEDELGLCGLKDVYYLPDDFCERHSDNRYRKEEEKQE